ncbi:hypothetical protein HYFRA_00004820 [Hymenoscyphus fraxineus]|uniref:Homeobox domain-containing protein n=1 Tax=Hymenoscyphus fraxineus TaxID=746836 RepID=A0A9N9KPE4_9HELO|nr:hypothetical protein HYFRA_00004820 [Hymenoscyphus fraxineus]
MPQFTPAQMEILEWEWQHRDGDDRPEKKRSISAAVEMSMVGPRVTSQAVGKYFSNRAAAESGRSRTQAKTPEQLEVLRSSWEDDPFPLTGERILLVHETGLQKAQVDSWFQAERKKAEKNGEDLWSRNRDNDPNAAAKMWRAYKRDPEGYVEGLTSGRIHPGTGEDRYIYVRREEEGEERSAVEEAESDGDEERGIKEEGRSIKMEEETIKIDERSIKVEKRRIKAEAPSVKLEERKVKIEERNIKVEERCVKEEVLGIKEEERFIKKEEDN